MRITLYEATVEQGNYIERIIIEGQYDEIYKFTRKNGFIEESKGLFKKVTPLDGKLN